MEKTKKVDLFLPTTKDTVLTTTNNVFTIPEVVKGTKTVEWQLNPTDLGLVGDTIALKAGKTQVGAIVAQAQIDPNQIGHLITDNNANAIALNPSPTTQNALNNTSTYDDVQIAIESLDNRFDDFLKQPITGNTSQQLWSGNLTNFQQTFVQNGLQPQTFNEMFNTLPNGYQGLTQDRLYGTRVRVKYEFKQGGQTQDIVMDDHYIYRWINAHNPDPNLQYIPQGQTQATDYSDKILFHRTFADGNGGFEREKEVELFLPQGVNTEFEKVNPNTDFDFQSGTSFTSSNSSVIWTFDPDPANASNSYNTNIAKGEHEESIRIKADGNQIGLLVAKGTGTRPITIDLGLNDFKNQMGTMLSSYILSQNDPSWGGQSVYYYQQPLYHNDPYYVASQRFINQYQNFLGVNANTLLNDPQFNTQLTQDMNDIFSEINEDFGSAEPSM